MLLFHLVWYVVMLLLACIIHCFIPSFRVLPLGLLAGSLLLSHVLILIAGYSPRGVATRPIVGETDERSSQPDPPPSLPLAKAWYVESVKHEGALPHSCSFIEFDERGDFLDFGQHRHAYEKVRALAKENEHLIVVLFVHGWRNNAHSGNVVSFNEFLHQLATFSDAGGVQHRVHGIYLSWRGACLRHSLERDDVYEQVTARFDGEIVDSRQAARCGWYNDFLETFSYFDRKGVPEHLISGTSLSRAIFSCAHATKRYRPKAHLFLIGHSFGGLTLERTFQNATIGELSKAWPWGDPELIKSAAANPLPFDMVLLVNSAAPSICAKQFQSYMAAHRQAMVRDRVRGANAPIFLSLTSNGDWATGKTHRWANILCFLLPTLRRSYFGADYILEKVPANVSLKIPQSYYYGHTPGHNPLLVNRFIEPCKMATAPPETETGRHLHANLRTDVADPMTFTTSPRKNGRTMEWKVNFPPITQEFDTFSRYDGRRPVAWTQQPPGTYLHKESGYWIIRCPKEIIADHSDIWSQQAMDTYAALYRIILVLRNEDLARKTDPKPGG